MISWIYIPTTADARGKGLPMRRPIAFIFVSLFTAILAIAQSEPPSITGHWEIVITFPQRVRNCRFEASANGKGVFSARTPEQATQSSSEDDQTAEWSEPKEGSMTLNGPIAFLLGNVGLERGRLILRGHFTDADSLVGEATFTPISQTPSSTPAQPAQTGTFKARRSSR